MGSALAIMIGGLILVTTGGLSLVMSVLPRTTEPLVCGDAAVL